MITAYASGLPNPTGSQTNAQVDLQGGDTLPTTKAIYGGGIDTADAGATFTFSWTLLRKPDGSAAALNSSSIQDPTVQGVDTWGNYRVFLIVTNSVTSETSETDPLRAPNSAFTTIEVLGEELQLQKPAGGERDWNTKAHAWVAGIEGNKGLIDGHGTRLTALEGQGIDDLSDVALGTLSTGQVLKYNGSEWSNATEGGGALEVSDEYGITQHTVDLASESLAFMKNTDDNVEVEFSTNVAGDKAVKLSLNPTVTIDTLNLNADLTLNADGDAADSTIYFNRGDIQLPYISYDQSESTFILKRDNAGGDEVIMTQDDVPDTTTRGGVRLSSAQGFSTYNTVGRLPRVERLLYTMATSQHVDYKNATQHNVSTPDNEIKTNTANNVSQPPAILFRNTTGGVIASTAISIIMASSGISTTTEYSFRLVSYSTLTNVGADTRTVDTALPTFVRLGDNQVGVTEWDYITHNASTPLEIAAGHYFGIYVDSEPDHAGNLMQVTLEAIKLL